MGVKLQKHLRGLDISDHICSCATGIQEEKSKCFILGSDSEPGRERSLGISIWESAQTRLLRSYELFYG